MLFVRIPIGRHFSNYYYSLVNAHIHTDRRFIFPNPPKINVFGLGGNQKHMQTQRKHANSTLKKLVFDHV